MCQMADGCINAAGCLPRCYSPFVGVFGRQIKEQRNALPCVSEMHRHAPFLINFFKLKHWGTQETLV